MGQAEAKRASAHATQQEDGCKRDDEVPSFHQRVIASEIAESA